MLKLIVVEPLKLEIVFTVCFAAQAEEFKATVHCSILISNQLLTDLAFFAY